MNLDTFSNLRFQIGAIVVNEQSFRGRSLMDTIFFLLLIMPLRCLCAR